MLINSAMNEGLAGMQQSQKKMLQAAQDIARAGLPTDTSILNPNATGDAPAPSCRPTTETTPSRSGGGGPGGDPAVRSR